MIGSVCGLNDQLVYPTKKILWKNIKVCLKFIAQAIPIIVQIEAIETMLQKGALLFKNL